MEIYLFLHLYRIDFWPPISQTVIVRFWKTISSTLNPMVGIVHTFSPSLNLYKMVVFPAASKPTMLILDWILPKSLFIIWLNKIPILMRSCRLGKKRIQSRMLWKSIQCKAKVSWTVKLDSPITTDTKLITNHNLYTQKPIYK